MSEIAPVSEEEFRKVCEFLYRRTGMLFTEAKRYYVQRRVTAQRETEQIAAHNLALVEQSRTLVQNASHVLRTPLTIALGHAELLQQAATS